MALIGVGAIMTFSGSNQGGRNATRRGGSTGRRVAPAQRSAGTRFARNAAVRLFGRRGTKAGLKLLKNFISPVVKRIPIIGTFIDFVLNYFVFKEPLGRSCICRDWFWCAWCNWSWIWWTSWYDNWWIRWRFCW